jgi:hypothetical protein
VASPPAAGTARLPLDEILEALDLSRAQPGVGLLERLFARFNAAVPFETVSKIERHAAVADSEQKPRVPEVFWREHLEWGSGGTCFARVAAFQEVLDALGFASRRILGRVTSDFDHAALLVEVSGESFLCDVGFPFPALVPAAEGETETALGTVALSTTPRGLRADLGGVPEGPRQIELFLAPVADEEYRRLWRGTFREESRFLSSVYLRRQLENRAVSFSLGEIRVDDLHARLRVPLLGSRAARLSEVFGLEQERIAGALARVGDPEPMARDATLTAYLETNRDPAEAFAAIASADGYRKLLEGVARVESVEDLPEGFLYRLSAPGSVPTGAPAEFEERVTPGTFLRRLRVERRSGPAISESFFEASERAGKNYLLRGVRLSGPREDLLRNDSLRGRLAGALAVDLLAWTRLLG